MRYPTAVSFGAAVGLAALVLQSSSAAPCPVSLWASRTLATRSAPYSVAIEDVNGDTIPDLALAELDHVSILIGNGDGTFEAPVTYAVGAGGSTVAVKDLR